MFLCNPSRKILKSFWCLLVTDFFSCSLGILSLGVFVGCRDDGAVAFPPMTDEKKFYNGVDLSFTPEIEGTGISFSDSGQTLPIASIFKRRGVNIIRLRLWHSPGAGHSDFHEVLRFARTLAASGMEFMLTLHYSDTWADPGHQSKPSLWANLSTSQLEDSLYAYTFNVMTALNAQNTLPAIIQIGNEINAGFLWNDGRVGGSFDANWTTFSTLLKRAIVAIHAAATNRKCLIMLHHAGAAGAMAFFGKIQQYMVPYDLIGISYYPVWHGKSLDTLAVRLNELAAAFEKDIFIAETAYPWTLQWNDWTHNVVGLESQLIPQYPATPEGQKFFLGDLKRLMQKLENGRGLGWCYWAPEWVAFRGPQATNGSAWENMTLFDFSNNGLPAIRTFGN